MGSSVLLQRCEKGFETLGHHFEMRWSQWKGDLMNNHFAGVRILNEWWRGQCTRQKSEGCGILLLLFHIRGRLMQVGERQQLPTTESERLSFMNNRQVKRLPINSVTLHNAPSKGSPGFR